MKEYPEHLVALGDNERMKEFLSEWDVIEEWVRDDFSYKLVSYWRKVRAPQTRIHNSIYIDNRQS